MKEEGLYVYITYSIQGWGVFVFHLNKENSRIICIDIWNWKFALFSNVNQYMCKYVMENI